MCKLAFGVVFFFIAFFQGNSSHPLIDAPVQGGKIKETPLDGGKVIYHKKLTQGGALSHCESKGGRLAVLLKKEDAESLVEKIYEISEKRKEDQNITEERKFDLGLSRRYWIGLTDVMKEEHFIWLHEGSELGYDELWTRGQPDHFRGGEDKNEHCISLWNPNFDKLDEGGKPNKHTFNDENCARKYYFICEPAG